MEEDLTRKEQRQDRKSAKKKDRSKYKKTDHSKWQIKRQLAQDQKLAKLDLHEGRVLLITPDEVVVEDEHKRYSCSVGGVLKKDLSRYKTIIAIGDIVQFDITSKRIVEIKPRRTILSRSDHLRRRKEQIIATNIDQVLITVSVGAPTLKPALIDRYIIAAMKGEMTPVILINKIDLLKKGSDEEKLYKLCVKLYRSLGLTVIGISFVNKKGLRLLKQQMKGKASVFSGQSGVGKSSLINAITGLSLPTQELRKARRGVHTTTQAKLISLKFGGWCVDTPGIKSFGIWDLTPEDLRMYYPEIDALSHQCHFPNCTHTHEPKCCVLQQLQEGNLSSLRYDSYLKLRQELT